MSDKPILKYVACQRSKGFAYLNSETIKKGPLKGCLRLMNGNVVLIRGGFALEFRRLIRVAYP